MRSGGAGPASCVTVQLVAAAFTAALPCAACILQVRQVGLDSKVPLILRVACIFLLFAKGCLSSEARACGGIIQTPTVVASDLVWFIQHGGLPGSVRACSTCSFFICFCQRTASDSQLLPEICVSRPASVHRTGRATVSAFVDMMPASWSQTHSLAAAQYRQHQRLKHSAKPAWECQRNCLCVSQPGQHE